MIIDQYPVSLPLKNLILPFAPLTFTCSALRARFCRHWFIILTLKSRGETSDLTLNPIMMVCHYLTFNHCLAWCVKL